MRETIELCVWMQDQVVGSITRDISGIMDFRYAEAWQKSGYSISQQMSLEIAYYPSSEGVAHRFFSNLLPEGNARDRLCRNLKIGDTDFDLLRSLGSECAGALTILPEGEENTTDGSYEKLDDQQFENVLVSKGSTRRPWSQGNLPRLSLAGAQEKLAVYYDGANFYLPQKSAASNHIIKFEIADYSNVPAYEYFLTELARACALPVVTCSFRGVKPNRYLLVERYDRFQSGAFVQRRHQEDFCQALGLSHNNKYQTFDGPSFAQCLELVRRVCTNPIADSERLLQWLVFNLLCGNSDGHAKNISLLYTENGRLALAPFYDLVCTRAIDHIDTKMAFSIGGEYDPGKITKEHIHALAEECGIRFSYLDALVTTMATSIRQHLDAVKTNFEEKHGPYPALQRVEQVINKMTQRILREYEHEVT